MAAVFGSGEQITVDYWAKRLVDVTELSLNMTDLNFQFCQPFAEVLKANTTLLSLDISSTNIGDDGIFFIAEALKFNNTLKSLYCRSCGITERGAFYLCEALKVNNTLITLALDENVIGNFGAHFIIQALCFNKVVHDIKLMYCKIDDELKDSIYELMNSNARCQAAFTFVKEKHIEENVPKIAPPAFMQMAPYNKFTSQNSDVFIAKGFLDDLTNPKLKVSTHIEKAFNEIAEIFSIFPADRKKIFADASEFAKSLIKTEPTKSLIKKQKISEDEVIAICIFTSVNTSSQDRMFDFNTQLRVMLFRRDPTEMTMARPFLAHLLRGLKKLPEKNGVVYRGRLSRVGLEGTFVLGHDVIFPAIECATPDAELAKKLSGPAGAVFKITVKRARDLTLFNMIRGESFVVFPPDAFFFVRNELRMNPSDGYCYVELVEKAGHFKW